MTLSNISNYESPIFIEKDAKWERDRDVEKWVTDNLFE